MTTETLTTRKPIRVTRLKDWPNALGFDCTVNSVRFTVLNDRQVGRLLAVRLLDNKVTHSCRIADSLGSQWVDGNRAVAELVYGIWRDLREQWIRHED